MRRLAGDHTQVVGKAGVIHGVDTHGHPRTIGSAERQLNDQGCVRRFAAHRSPVFAIERNVEDAGTKLLGELRLQLQALAHAHFHAAVVIAHRQHASGGLRVKQDFARVSHGCTVQRIRWNGAHAGFKAGGPRQPARRSVP